MKKLCYGIALSACLLGQAYAEVPKTIKEDPYLLLELFGSAFKEARSVYVDETSDRQLIENAIDGMLSSLDPHSGFMNEQSFLDMQIQTKGEFGGLGIEVTMENGLVRVISPIDGTPAAEAGLQPGDYITHIDDLTVVGLSLNEAVDKMRGKPDTRVTLTVQRRGEEPRKVELKRAIIKIESVRFEPKGDIGYIRIITFADTTQARLKTAIKELTDKIGADKIQGFLLDLRNNPGGLLDQAVEVADAFLEQGEIVSTRSRRPEETERFSATAGDLTKGAPLVVLINEGSASASEIVAGALQDQKRAVLVGTPSFGKGSVQSVIPVPGYGALKITTARYYTPSGRSIQAQGIEPDILVPRAEIKEQPIIEGFSESNLPNALTNETEDVKKNTDDKKAPVEGKEKSEEKVDYQLDRAIDILKAISVYRSRREDK